MTDGNLQGQFVPSELMAAMLTSGQQPKGVLTQEDRTSGGVVVVATVVPEERDEDVTQAGFLEF